MHKLGSLDGVPGFILSLNMGAQPRLVDLMNIWNWNRGSFLLTWGSIWNLIHLLWYSNTRACEAIGESWSEFVVLNKISLTQGFSYPGKSEESLSVETSFRLNVVPLHLILRSPIRLRDLALSFMMAKEVRALLYVIFLCLKNSIPGIIRVYYFTIERGHSCYRKCIRIACRSAWSHVFHWFTILKK